LSGAIQQTSSATVALIAQDETQHSTALVAGLLAALRQDRATSRAGLRLNLIAPLVLARRGSVFSRS
jgi:hypothetical protein